MVPAAMANRPDVALLDIEMPHMDGLAAAPAREGPECGALILTTFGRAGFRRRAMESGASGFIVKDAPADQLADAVRRVARGERVVDPALAAATLAAGPSPLTRRDRDVLAVSARDRASEPCRYAANTWSRRQPGEGTLQQSSPVAAMPCGRGWESRSSHGPSTRGHQARVPRASLKCGVPTQSTVAARSRAAPRDPASLGIGQGTPCPPRAAGVRAVVYRRTGPVDVLQLVERPAPEPGPHEVLVRVAVSGVNPTDWKSRRGSGPDQPLPFPEVVPNQDGAGTIVAVGAEVDPLRIGQRVWLWEAAWERANGTAQELLALPEDHAVPLPDEASFELGASLGIPALTAHRCLTVGAEGPERLSPGILVGRTVLVAGGAGAVGHAAIQLAVWAGATVLTTVSSPKKGDLARAAGANHVINYRTENAVHSVRKVASAGVDLIVEVAPVGNAPLDQEVLARNGTIATYANDQPTLPVAVRSAMVGNSRYQFVMVYTVPPTAKQRAVEDIDAAVTARALPVGAVAGLPLTHFPLEGTAEAHAAVERGVLGKVVIDVG